MLIIGSLCATRVVLADRGEEEAGRSLAQRVAATQQRLDALQEKQERVMKKLELEVADARKTPSTRSSSLGQMDAEIQSSRTAIAKQLESHIGTLKAELKLLNSPEFEYSNFKQAAQLVHTRSEKIGQAIDRMTANNMHGLITKAQDYQQKNSEYQEAMKQMKDRAIWATQEAIHKDKKKELADIDKTNYEDAFTHNDRERLRKATQADWDLLKRGKFKYEDRHIDFGENPYQDLSRGASWGQRLSNTHPLAENVNGAMDSVQDSVEPPVDSVHINIEPPIPEEPNSLVQVLPHAFAHQKNQSRTEEQRKNGRGTGNK